VSVKVSERGVGSCAVASSGIVQGATKKRSKIDIQMKSLIF
jgi:hypothetical protein